MIEVLKNPFEDKFLSSVRLASKNIVLCAPYIKSNLIDKILRVKKEKTNIQLISKLSLGNFAAHVSDINAIETIVKNGYEAFNQGNLHAKIYMFDDYETIITSGNLTHNGMNHNYEYGLRLINEALIQDVKRDLNEIVNNNDKNLINLKKINEIKGLLMNYVDEKDLIRFNEDEILLPSKTIVSIKENAKLSNAQRVLLNILIQIDSSKISLDQIYSLKDIFKRAYPTNKSIEATIRRTLQELRDKGLLMFLGNDGTYRKLWI